MSEVPDDRCCFHRSGLLEERQKMDAASGKTFRRTTRGRACRQRGLYGGKIRCGHWVKSNDAGDDGQGARACHRARSNQLRRFGKQCLDDQVSSAVGFIPFDQDLRLPVAGLSKPPAATHLPSAWTTGTAARRRLRKEATRAPWSSDEAHLRQHGRSLRARSRRP